MTPKVSLVIPVYNGMPYLKATIASLLGQTFSNFELLLLDDGSTDGSRDYISEIKDPRVRVILKENTGLCETLNLSLELIRGHYWARLDQDDVSDSTRIEKQVDALENDSWDCLFSNINKIGDLKSWSNSDQQMDKPGEIDEFAPMVDGCMVHSTMMIKTEVLRKIEGYRAEFYPCDDWDLELRLVSAGFRVGVIRESLVDYRFHNRANTLRTFSVMQDKRRWVESCYEARLQGRPEPTEAQYFQRKVSVYRRLNRLRKDYHRYFSRLAGGSYLEAQHMQFLLYAALSFLLSPARIISRILRAVASRAR